MAPYPSPCGCARVCKPLTRGCERRHRSSLPPPPDHHRKTAFSAVREMMALQGSPPLRAEFGRAGWM